MRILFLLLIHILIASCGSSRPSRDEMRVKKALHAQKRKLQACFAKYTPRFQNSTQKISFRMMIDDRGRARRINFEQNIGTRMRNCLVLVISRISFPPPDKGNVREIREEFVFTRKVRRK